MYTHSLILNHYKDLEPASPVVVGGVVIVVVAGFIYAWLRGGGVSGKGQWYDGKFPINYAFNRDHLMEAYISAAGIIVRHDPGRTAGKLGYINSYLLREFRDVYYDFKESYLHSLKYPVSEKSLAAWLNKNLRSVEDKKRIVWFVVELALWDGKLNTPEYRSILALITALGLQKDEFESYIYSHQRSEQKQNTTQSSASDELEVHYFKVLGLEQGSSPEMIKTAYRRLVKMVHPDRHSHASPEVQQQYATQFQQIKEAYDYLIQDN